MLRKHTSASRRVAGVVMEIISERGTAGRRRVVCFIEPVVALAKCFRSLLMFVNP